MALVRVVSYEKVGRLEVAVDHIEVVKERERAQRFDGEIEKQARPGLAHRVDEIDALHVLHGERGSFASNEKVVDFDEIGVAESCKCGELAPQAGGTLGARRG
jgi:hypothetical protein